MSTVIITNCTNRKRLGGHSPLELCASQNLSLAALATAWARQLSNPKAILPAASLYAGRSVRDAKWVAKKLNAELMFASAGLGLIESEHPCPPYNLTIAAVPGSIRPRLERMGLSASDWWDAINRIWHRPSPISELAHCPKTERILIALSANYIDLIANDLKQITISFQHKIRLFTSRPGIARLPSELRPFAMPYDERLESCSSFAGTQSDFPQRAMRHFVEHIKAPTDCADADYRAVLTAMDALIPVAVVKRRKASDEEVQMLMTQAWEVHKGSSSRLLRYLRDEALVSCEQSRFRGLWLELKTRNMLRSKV